MPVHDPKAQRLFLEADLSRGSTVACSAEQANYLVNVLRLGTGDGILVFNGRDGEWQALLDRVQKRGATLVIEERVRPQEPRRDLDYLFAPLKRARLDYMVQKAVEMGVGRLRPVLTHRTIVERVNTERMRANAIEAAEQCGILAIPAVSTLEQLDRVLDGWEPQRRLVFCDEEAAVHSPIAALASLGPGPLAVLIGPEGGFSPEERTMLLEKPFALPISLGPRVMRADTAAVAALALVNAVAGDWR